jgi:hypothetical protein
VVSSSGFGIDSMIDLIKSSFGLIFIVAAVLNIKKIMPTIPAYTFVIMAIQF